MHKTLFRTAGLHLRGRGSCLHFACEANPHTAILHFWVKEISKWYLTTQETMGNTRLCKFVIVLK